MNGSEIKRYRSFNVTVGVIGFKINIGCAELYVNKEQLIDLLIRYMNDPDKCEKEILEKDIRKEVTTTGPLGLGPIGVNPAPSLRGTRII
jgi:hypothetical protein